MIDMQAKILKTSKMVFNMFDIDATTTTEKRWNRSIAEKSYDLSDCIRQSGANVDTWKGGIDLNSVQCRVGKNLRKDPSWSLFFFQSLNLVPAEWLTLGPAHFTVYANN